jgi:type IV pilus assembly protein PilV
MLAIMQQPLPMRRSFAAHAARARKRYKGVALLEALISLVIFSVGVLGLMALEARAVSFSVNAEDRNRASLFANDVASSMWLAGTVTVTAAQLALWQAAMADPTTAGLPNGTIAVASVAGSTNSADVTITWKATTALATDPSNKLTTRVVLP